MADLGEQILNAFKEKTIIQWRYIDDIVLIREHGKKSLEKCLSSFHATIKFTEQ